ncbi:MAG: hypothetical protein WKF89_17055 [Chitinophagaceae bacterium]
MNQELNMRQNISKWFNEHTHVERDIIFPVPVSTAVHRLKIGFASPKRISKGFFQASYKYTGEVNETEITVHFTVTARSSLKYLMHGKFFTHPKGSHIKMVVKPEPAFLFLITPLILFLLVAFFQRGVVFTVVTGLFSMMFYPIMLWHLNAAANNVSSLVSGIVATPSSFSDDAYHAEEPRF